MLNCVIRVRAWTATLLVVFGCGLSTDIQAQSVGRELVNTDLPMVRENKTSPQKVISIDVKDSSLSFILMSIAKQAGRPIVLNNANTELAKRMNMKIQTKDVMAAFELALKQTGLVVVLAKDGETFIVKSGTSRSTAEDSTIKGGTIAGRVKDSAAGKPVENVSIRVKGTRRMAMTNAQGEFSIGDVPAGAHVIEVRSLGHMFVESQVNVKVGEVSSVSISLRPSATVLSGVVTTATGMQRKVELGNDITTLKVDSLIKAAPVDNLSDLLATRVPGVYAMPSSGNPGAPTKIRIRGLSSANQSNDPIIIVDGIRVAYDQTTASNNMAVDHTMTSVATGAGTFHVSSPLDLIDINNVETIEVFKGPSAVALYGSDAANGVIVVTTKRGKTGPTRYTANARFGVESIPGKWPINYYMFGHNSNDPTISTSCTLLGQVQGTCIPDSLVMYQILNDERRTPLGHGLTQAYSANVSGGGSGLTYSLTGSINKTDGMIKLPEVDEKIIKDAGKSIPAWVRNPESDVKRSLGLNISVELGKASSVSWTSQLFSSLTTSSPLRRALSYAKNAPPEMDTLASGLLTGIPDFRTKINSRNLKASNSLDLQSSFASIIKTQLQIGGDWTVRNDQASLGATECFVVTTTCLNDGRFNTGENIGSVLTANARASVPARVGRLLSLRNSVGLNWTRNQDRTLLVNASGLAVGATSGNEAAAFTQNQSQNDRITAGVYLESVIGIADRWYLPLAIRTDAGSALGSNVAPKFPKLGFSYVMSDDDWFVDVPGSQIFSMLRIRGAFGIAGVQPNKSRNLRTFQSGFDNINNSSIPYLTLNTIGNTNLRPERSREYELGFDSELWDNRINTSVTFYRKLTNDLIIDQSLAPSVGEKQQINLGDLRNSGIEVTMNIVPINGALARLASDLSFIRNKNMLLRLGSQKSASEVGIGVIARPGYPLHGYWSKQILGVYDINGDGYISNTEYVLSDSASFLGASYPDFALSANHELSIYGNFTVRALMQYEHNLTQMRNENSATVRAYFDPETPLNVQAAHLYSDMNKIQTVSLFRLQELTFSYLISRPMVRSALGGRNVRVSVQARNVGLWTNYRGKDPKVGGYGDEASVDNGIVPQPRRWQFTFSII